MGVAAAAVAILASIPCIAWAAGCPVGTVTQYCFPDPFNGANIPTIIKYVISALLSLVGALFFVMFLWGGVTWLTAGGDADKVKKARTTLTNAVIGLAIVALSYVLVTNVFNVLTAARTTAPSGPAAPSNVQSRPGDVLFE